jgi:hypothetical protein
VPSAPIIAPIRITLSKIEKSKAGPSLLLIQEECHSHTF